MKKVLLDPVGEAKCQTKQSSNNSFHQVLTFEQMHMGGGLIMKLMLWVCCQVA